MEWIESPNYTSGRGNKNIGFIIIHWFGVGNIDGAISSFQNPDRQASAHYLISDERIVQMVRDNDTAWHCGNYEMNQQSIGIEHDAGIDPQHDLSDRSYQTSGKLIKELCEKYNIPLDRDHIKGHNEISSTQCPGTINIDKIIEIAKGDNMDKQDVAKAISRMRSGNFEQNEVDYIIREFIDKNRPLEDYASNNGLRDDCIENSWFATTGEDNCPIGEKDFWQRDFQLHSDRHKKDLIKQWWNDHAGKWLKDKDNKIKELTENPIIKEIIKEVKVEVPVEKIVEKEVIKEVPTPIESISKLDLFKELLRRIFNVKKNSNNNSTDKEN